MNDKIGVVGATPPADTQSGVMNNAQFSRAEQANCEICPLSRVQTGMQVRIKRLCASPEVQYRLRELGIREEQVIRLLISQTSFVCQVCNARLALSDKLARIIMVEPLVPAMAASRRRSQ